MKINANKIKKIVHEAIEKVLSGKTETPTGIETVSDEQMADMMDFMDSNMDEQNSPKVGIFWYSPRIKDVFGVVAYDAKYQCEVEKNRDNVSCKELHKYVWKKQFNYWKYHGGSKLFVGDYKDTPRGRIFYNRQNDEFSIMVGSWIDEYPEAIEKIKEAFDLNGQNTNVSVKKGIHWEIGMGYGD